MNEKATRKQVAYIHARNEELQAYILNSKLEPEWAEIVNALNTKQNKANPSIILAKS